MLRDRGTIKWTALMLPEHVELLKEVWQEEGRIRKPILDLQELELINQQLIDAYEQQLSISIAMYQDGSIVDVHGTLVKLDTFMGHVILQSDAKHTIAFHNILAVSYN